MGKIAFVFSGQGDQYPGMGKDLCERYTAAAAVFELCDRIRPGTSRQCFSGTEEQLSETYITQPCLFAVEMATFAVLLDRGVKPDAAAGFSLGEVTAAAASGLFDIETGFRLVCARGDLMQKAAEKADTSMAAVLRLEADKVIELCERYPEVYPVNFNCPGQVTVSGLTGQLETFIRDVRAEGGRAAPLKVRGGFHSPFMKDAAESFAAVLRNTEIREGRIPLYSNMTAEPYTEDVVSLLSGQICSPVQWESTIRNMISAGIDTFIEIGPGKTLTSLIRRISERVEAVSTADYLKEA